MTFEEKVALIEQARVEYPEFNEEFLDLLGRGYSFNGAYNHFSEADINKYKKKVIEPVKPVQKPKAVEKPVVTTKEIKTK